MDMYTQKTDHVSHQTHQKCIQNNVFRIPVIANGGVEHVGDADRVLEITGADGIMAAGTPNILCQHFCLLRHKCDAMTEMSSTYLCFVLFCVFGDIDINVF